MNLAKFLRGSDPEPITVQGAAAKPITGMPAAILDFLGEDAGRMAVVGIVAKPDGKIIIKVQP